MWNINILHLHILHLTRDCVHVEAEQLILEVIEELTKNIHCRTIIIYFCRMNVSWETNEKVLQRLGYVKFYLLTANISSRPDKIIHHECNIEINILCSVLLSMNLPFTVDKTERMTKI